jgi:O-antigen ligase
VKPIAAKSAREGQTGESRAAAALAATAMAGVALAIAPGAMLQYDTTPKLVVAMVCTAGLLLCYRSWWPGLQSLSRTAHGRLLTVLLAAQAISLVLAASFSSQPVLSFAGSSWRRYGVATQLCLELLSLIGAATVVACAGALRKILLAIAVSGGAIALYAIAQYAGLDPFLARILYTTNLGVGQVVRPPGTLGHAVYLGGFLAAVVPITAVLAWEARSAKRVFFLGITGLSLAAMVVSGSRSALLALAAGAMVFAPSLRRIRWRGFAGVMAVCAPLILAAAIFVPLSSGGGYRMLIQRWRQDVYGGPRLRVWRESLAMVAAHPLVGSGPETFSNEFRRRESAELSRAYPDFVQESPHNLLLDGATSQGLPFLVVMAGLVYLVFACTRSAASLYSKVVCASFIATFVSLLFLSVTIPGALMLYGTAALLAASRIAAGETTGRPASRTGLAIASGLALILVVASVAYARKDLAYSGITHAATFDEMAQAYQASAQPWLPPPGEDLWCSRQFAAIAPKTGGALAAKAWALAAEAAARAEATGEDRADAAYQSALLAIGANQPQPAEQKIRQAIEDAPNWYKPHFLLAELLYFTGRTTESKDEAARAISLAGSMQASVEQTLRETLK